MSSTRRKTTFSGRKPTTKMGRLLQQAGYVRETFAAKMGVSAASITTWFHYGFPQARVAKAARLLKVDVKQIPVNVPNKGAVRVSQPVSQPKPPAITPYRDPAPRTGPNDKREWENAPIPTGPLVTLARLIRRRDGIIGYPWVEIVNVVHAPAHGERAQGQTFYDALMFFVRVPSLDGKEVVYRWFSHTDLFGDGADSGEYDADGYDPPVAAPAQPVTP